MLEKQIERALSLGYEIEFSAPLNNVCITLHNGKRTVSQQMPMDHCNEKLAGCLEFCINKLNSNIW